MKKVFGYFRNFHSGYFKLGMYLSVALWAAVLIAFNYSLDFEDEYIDSLFMSEWRTVAFFAFHGVAWLGTYGIIRLWSKPEQKLSGKAWLFLAFGLLVLAWDRSFFYYVYLTDEVPRGALVFTSKTSKYYAGFITCLLPLALFRYGYDRRAGDGLYGFNSNGTNIKLYLILLALMVPLLLGAFLMSDIQDYYPVVRRAGVPRAAAALNWPEWLAYVVYELGYAFDFISVELIFRGFLIIGLSRFFGKDVLLPMVVCYCTLHFGKPMTETISSLFGGYILGTLAFYSRNIYGGLFVHVGIALLMELLGSVFLWG